MNMDQRWREEVFSLYKKGSWVTIGNHTVKDNGFGLVVLYVTANSSKQNDCKDNLREWSNHLLLESLKIFGFHCVLVRIYKVSQHLRGIWRQNFATKFGNGDGTLEIGRKLHF